MPREDVALLAPAKINLALHVTGRRADGYHLLDSVAVFADLGDRVAIATADTLALEVTGTFAAHAPGDRNDLAFRAAEAFFAATAIAPAASIRVEKEIPAGAGLGGGSADAAAVLNGLNRHFDAALPPERLAAIGLELGADVPMCLVGQTLRARGIGETIDLVEGWPALPLVLVWPGTGVSTPAAFKALARRDNPPLPEPRAMTDVAAAADWLAHCRNDLETPARALAPEIGAVLDALSRSEDCLLARMSGSGSACFGLYADDGTAASAAMAIAAAHPDWWCRATQTR